jgi:peptidoglycan/LPS O-acetylase OafA/YrhL
MIKSLEGVRGIAALIVALYHFQLGTVYAGLPVIRHGYLFVDLFFVLSGFVMCAAYAGKLKSSEDFGRFLVRRTGRLLPLLLFSTLIFLLVADGIVLAKKLAVAHGYGAFLNNPGALRYQVPSALELLTTFTMTHSLGVFDHLILNTPSWSISVEFYTYIIFAGVCLLCAGGRRLVAFALLSAIGMAVSVWGSLVLYDCVALKNGCFALTYDLGLMRCIASFFLGALVYYASRNSNFNSPALQLAAGFVLCLVFALLDLAPAAAFAVPFAFALLVFAICTDTGPVARALKPRLIQLLGQRSYSIYLMHMPLLLVFENISKRATGPFSLILVLAVYVVLLFVLAGWTYRFIENPFRIWFYQLADRRPERVAPTQAEPS